MTSLAESHENNRNHIRQVGGVEAILQAKWNHGKHQSVALAVRQALEALGYDDPEGCCYL